MEEYEAERVRGLVARLATYIGNGDWDGFDGDDPFARFGGYRTICREIVVGAKVASEDELPRPDGDSEWQASKCGNVAGRASLSRVKVTALRAYFKCGREKEELEGFTFGFNEAVAYVESEAKVSTKSSGYIPAGEEASRIEAETGLSWQEGEAFKLTLVMGTSPSREEVLSLGYGKDPASNQIVKDAKKVDQETFKELQRKMSGKDWLAFMLDGAESLTDHGYKDASSLMTRFALRLSQLTIDCGNEPGYAAYMKAYMLKRRKKIPKYSDPIYQDILQLEVLARRAAVTVNQQNSNSSDEVATMKAQLAEQQKETNNMRSQLGQARADLNRLRNGQDQGETSEQRSEKPRNAKPSKDNPCGYCGSPDHFKSQCPMKMKHTRRRLRRQSRTTPDEVAAP